jgi:hypothetical protein
MILDYVARLVIALPSALPATPFCRSHHPDLVQVALRVARRIDVVVAFGYVVDDAPIPYLYSLEVFSFESFHTLPEQFCYESLKRK